jgi:hypothetical protein
MKISEYEPYESYRITYPDCYKGKVAEAIHISAYGDVTLEFKNKNQVVYHIAWLERE